MKSQLSKSVSIYTSATSRKGSNLQPSVFHFDLAPLAISDGGTTRWEFPRVPHVTLSQSPSLFTSHGSCMQIWLANTSHHCPLAIPRGWMNLLSCPSETHTCAPQQEFYYHCNNYVFSKLHFSTDS